MKYTLYEFGNQYLTLTDALFMSDEFERYIHFFDRLIAINKIPVGCYKETDDIILKLSEMLDEPNKAFEFYINQGCDYMFDLYHRYQILLEYLETAKSIEVMSKQRNECFKELFLKTWVLGIPTFTCKNFR